MLTQPADAHQVLFVVLLRFFLLYSTINNVDTFIVCLWIFCKIRFELFLYAT